MQLTNHNGVQRVAKAIARIPRGYQGHSLLVATEALAALLEQDREPALRDAYARLGREIDRRFEAAERQGRRRRAH